MPMNQFILFQCFIRPSPTKKIRKVLLLIWELWKIKNDKVFGTKGCPYLNVEESIKEIS